MLHRQKVARQQIYIEKKEREASQPKLPFIAERCDSSGKKFSEMNKTARRVAGGFHSGLAFTNRNSEAREDKDKANAEAYFEKPSAKISSKVNKKGKHSR